MNLQHSEVLIDRALITLCSELPESLGLYNTAKDQFTIGAMRAIPMLEDMTPDSRKHYIMRDWMRTYVENEDQPLTNEVSFDSLREIIKKERKQRIKDAKEQNGELLSDDDETVAQEKPRKEKSNGKAKAKPKPRKKEKKKSTVSHENKKRRPRDESESEVSDSSSTSMSSSDSSDSDSSDDDRRSRAKGKSTNGSSAKKKDKDKAKSKSPSSNKSNLPSMTVVLSSDEDEEPDDLFDEDDPDVYEVETILEKRRGTFGHEDQYLIKWVGYDDPTWEPASNVSKDLIEEFDGQPVRANEYVVEEIVERKSMRDKKTNLKTFKYLVKWVGYDDMTWEPAENLPHNLRRKFDSKHEAQKRRKLN